MDAIIAPGGTMRCAFSAGVMHELNAQLGGLSQRFDRFYGSSSGALALIFHLASQSDLLQEAMCASDTPWHGVWSLRNPFHGRPPLDLKFLFAGMRERGLQPERAAETGKLSCVVTDVREGHPIYVSFSDQQQVWDHMAATTAVPYVYPAVEVNGNWVADGMLSDPLPVKRALDDGCQKVVVIDNHPPRGIKKWLRVIELCAYCVPRPRRYQCSIGKLMSGARQMRSEAERLIATTSNMRVIRPSCLPLRSTFDSSPKGMSRAFKQGVKDARQFLREHPQFL